MGSEIRRRAGGRVSWFAEVGKSCWRSCWSLKLGAELGAGARACSSLCWTRAHSHACSLGKCVTAVRRPF